MYYQINFSPAPPKLFGLNSSALIKTAFTQLHTVAYLVSREHHFNNTKLPRTRCLVYNALSKLLPLFFPPFLCSIPSPFLDKSRNRDRFS